MVIKCVGQVFDIYNETTKTTIVPLRGSSSSIAGELNDPDSLQHSTSNDAQSTRRTFLIIPYIILYTVEVTKLFRYPPDESDY